MPHRPMVPDVDPGRDWAESGILALTGRPDGPPVVPPGRAASVARELTSWIADTTAGSSRPVLLDGAQLLAERAAFTGRGRRGCISVGGSCRLLPTADGWAAVSCARPDDPALLGAMISEEVDESDPWPAVGAWLAEHSGAELAERAELLGIAAGPVADSTAVAPVPLAPRSVDGLLVVDFSALWAGPLCAHILGLAGARVVKVETPLRPDGARWGNADFYTLLHGGHSSVVLDPAVPSDLRAMQALVEAADIVIEASRPRALARFGLNAEALIDRGGTWISITADGRASERVGFGDDIAATAGLVAREEHRSPMFVGDAIADPLAGLTAAALALSAPADGAGTLWDVSMRAIVSATVNGGETARVRHDERRWMVETRSGAVDISPPRRRPPHGRVSAIGEDTASTLRSLGIPMR